MKFIYFIFITQPILIALIITSMIELTVLVFFKIKDYKIYLVMFITNCITNVSMNLSLELVSYEQDTLYLGFFEILVFIIEGIVLSYLLKNVRLGFLISFVANIASLVLGLILMPLIYHSV